MALTTSGSSADSYATLIEADNYADNHFVGSDFTAWDGATDPDKEARLRQAAQWLDANFRSRYVGIIRSESQALEWPRSGAIDRSGRTINNVPDAVKNAQIELAKYMIVNSANLVPAEDRGGQVKREKVGPIEVEYMDNAPSGTTYRWAEQLLSQVLGSSVRRVVRV